MTFTYGNKIGFDEDGALQLAATPRGTDERSADLERKRRRINFGAGTSIREVAHL